MAEPDLKQAAERLACPAWPDCVDDEGPCLACAQAAALVSALEDRERLLYGVRAVQDAILAGGPDWMTNRDAALYDLFEVWAALERHDG